MSKVENIEIYIKVTDERDYFILSPSKEKREKIYETKMDNLSPTEGTKRSRTMVPNCWTGVLIKLIKPN